MFRSKTVFILGAGSSEEVGLPIGEGLKDLIAGKLDINFEHFNRQTSGDFRVMDALWRHTALPSGTRGDPNPYIKAAHRLRLALPQAISIDNLLDAYRDDEQSEVCGKLGIVGSILDSENSSSMYLSGANIYDTLDFGSLGNTWFAGFVRILTENVAKNDVDSIFDNVSFVNFNYDRCLEHYLYHSLQVYYGLDSQTTATLLKKLKVHRPYGSVGMLPWQDGSRTTSIPYGAQQIDLLSLSKQIKTFNEQIHDAEEVQVIRSAIQEAEVMVFLGFAFHRQNLELIKPQLSCSAKRLYGTAFGISNSDRNILITDLEKFLNQVDSKASIELRIDLKCAALFKEYWRSLTAGI